MNQRGGGILLHISSLPSKYGIGDLGPEAYRFVDFLSAARQRYWQILPLNPTAPLTDNSPYLSQSTFASNPMLISPDRLVEAGWLDASDLEPIPDNPTNQIQHLDVIQYKNSLFNRAFKRFQEAGTSSDFESFCESNRAWLDPFALFTAIKNYFTDLLWIDWPKDIRDRNPKALAEMRKEHAEGILKAKFLQYIFFKQWKDLKSYCNGKGIRILGDVPIYVALDSVDVWSNPELFKLDSEKRPIFVAGCPPDYFSATGQLWGNPVYDWEAIRKSGYRWWIERIRHNIELFDFTRIDHFRGLVAYWEIPGQDKTAVNGKWVPAPAVEFLTRLKEECHDLPIFAEDLGTITPDVLQVMEQFNLPGMKVLQFAFGGDVTKNPYIPYNVPKHSVLYTGTHDNNTTRGWFERDASEDEKRHLFSYVGRSFSSEEAPEVLMRMALSSRANTAIIPIQDVLKLGGEDRINNPALNKDNWKWKLKPGLLNDDHARLLAEMAWIYGRAG
jgi:4-alpha-glucanotransferase